MVREYIYGPFRSRRLGLSLGVNILREKKICTFNCVYCEIGCTHAENLVSPAYTINKTLNSKFAKELESMLRLSPNLDSITFGYNGETTLNPEIDKFLEQARKVRDKIWNQKKPRLSLFTNSSTMHLKNVRSKIKNFDLILAKLDAGNQEDFLRTCRPHKEVLHISEIIDSLAKLRKEKPNNTRLAIQTLFYNSYKDFENNTNNINIETLAYAIKKIKPEIVQIYSIARIPAEYYVYSIDLGQKNEIVEKFKKIINNNSIEINFY
ncbi:MAG: radical SAM protein [Candidatus Lokiarchaeota archaeon]